jgi:hypothetical protein
MSSEVSTEEAPWTLERFKYEFFLCLAQVTGNNQVHNESQNDSGFFSDRKYYLQARNIIYRIPVSKPIPHFVINFTDLTPELQTKFGEFCELNEPRQIAVFLKDVAARFFENVNYRYTHDSVLKHLLVVLEK